MAEWEKLDLHTPDRASANFRRLADLFPNAVTEVIAGRGADGRPILQRAIDADVLRQEIAAYVVEGREERYQFTWPDKRRAVLAANAPSNRTLRPCREESAAFDTTENLYLEGDNLEVLKLLQETYPGKIKMIYIDPPYNTGSDLIYRDNFEQSLEDYLAGSAQSDGGDERMVPNLERSGRFHTDWLNMMYPRLRLARDLLTEDGVILINMDENEIDNLQKLCTEIFGEENHLGTIIWDKRNPKGDARGISYQHEYIVAYARNRSTLTAARRIRRPKKNARAILKKAEQLFAKLSPDYPLEAVNADFAAWMKTQTDFSGGEKAYCQIDENGDVYRPVSMAWPNKKKAPDDYFVPLIHPVTQKPCPVPERGWRNPSATMRRLLAEGRILFGADETTIPNSKYLLKENQYENIPSLLYYGGSDTDLLLRMKIPFDTPKVVSICQEHIACFTDKDDIILDFFSGSATTAHAVMQLNAEDGGHRKFIMVQWPEEIRQTHAAYQAGYRNICEIGKDRIRRAAEKIAADHPEAQFDGGFRVLKCDTSNRKDVYRTPGETQMDQLDLLADNIKADRTPEDLLFQTMLELGIPLSSPIEVMEAAGKTLFDVNGGHLLACFDAKAGEETITAAAKRKPRYFVMRDSSIANDAAAVNFAQIFQTYSPDTVRKVL